MALPRELRASSTRRSKCPHGGVRDVALRRPSRCGAADARICCVRRPVKRPTECDGRAPTLAHGMAFLIAPAASRRIEFPRARRCIAWEGSIHAQDLDDDGGALLGLCFRTARRTGEPNACRCESRVGACAGGHEFRLVRCQRPGTALLEGSQECPDGGRSARLHARVRAARG